MALASQPFSSSGEHEDFSPEVAVMSGESLVVVFGTEKSVVRE